MWWIDFFSSLLAYVVLNTEEQEFLKKGFANDIKILARWIRMEVYCTKKRYDESREFDEEQRGSV